MDFYLKNLNLHVEELEEEWTQLKENVQLQEKNIAELETVLLEWQTFDHVMATNVDIFDSLIQKLFSMEHFLFTNFWHWIFEFLESNIRKASHENFDQLGRVWLRTASSDGSLTGIKSAYSELISAVNKEENGHKKSIFY